MLTDALRVRLSEARRRLAEEPTTTITVTELAADCGLTPSHFIRRFKTVFGETPHQFRIRSRLERVRRQLATGNQSITDICMASSAASLGSFTSQFTQRVGRSPSRYRNEIKARHPTLESLRRSLQPACIDLMNHALAKDADRDFREASSAKDP